jgi:hypothetical protein
LSLRRKLFVAAGAEVLVIVAVFVVHALGSDPNPLRARRVLTLFMMTQALVAAFAPLFGAELAARGSYRQAALAVLEPLGWAMAVCLSAPLLLGLFCDRGGLLLWLKALPVVAGAGLASAGLTLMLSRLTRRPMLAVCLAAALILLFEFQPLYTFSAIKSFYDSGSPRAQRLLIETGVRTSWMGVAHAMKNSLWQYDLNRPTLYPKKWIGSDYGVLRPGPLCHFLEYLVVAALLAGLATLRGKPQESGTDTHHEDHEEHEEPHVITRSREDTENTPHNGP